MAKKAWEVRMDAIDERLDRMTTLGERSDKRVDAILRLMQTGAKQLIAMQEAQKAFFERINRPNGHKKEK
jgi:hypothetical protein